MGIADGDTLTLLDAEKRQHKIRLAGIDAPEKRQPFGQRAKDNLSQLAFAKTAEADCPKRDRYRRAVCTVRVEGRDIALAQLRAGLAWWFRKYAHEQPPAQRHEYGAAEALARQHHAGLWLDADPLAPWAWRALRRHSNGTL